MKKRLAMAFLLVAVIGAVIVAAAAVAFALPRKSFTLEGVQRVTVTGNNILSAREVLKTAGFPDPVTAQKLKPSAMCAALRKNRFVRGAWVERKGSTVLVRIAEARPYFRMVAGDKRYWLGRDGDAIVMDPARDRGPLFDELRRRVTVRMAGPQMLEDAQMLAQAVYAAMRLEEILPMQFAEMRVSTKGDYQLVMRNGMLILLGGPEGLDDNLAVLDKTIRAARNLNRPVSQIDFRDSTHVVVKVGKG
jgi:cell division septal protein FtsQ